MQVIAKAIEFGVEGYKVNGAGGVGGSVTLLMKADTRKKACPYRGDPKAKC